MEFQTPPQCLRKALCSNTKLVQMYYMSFNGPSESWTVSPVSGAEINWARASPCLPIAVLCGLGIGLHLELSSFPCARLFRISALQGSSACSKLPSGNSECDTALALTEDIFPCLQ